MDVNDLRNTWNYPTTIRFGAGRINELAGACRSLGMNRPLLVTDPGLAGMSIVRQARAANEAGGLPTGLFFDIRPNPVIANVTAGVAFYRDGGYDGIIAFGGGSALDVGKTIALMVGQTRDLLDFEDVGDNWRRADTAGIAPVVAVPTTAGTGSETGRASVITDEMSHNKKIIFHPKMMPAIVIADPELTIGLPPHVTAATGMDALAHNLEAYCSPRHHPMADGIAVEGMRLIKTYLPVAYRNGADLVARAEMMAAASMGSTAFQKGLGAVHSLSHPIGAIYDTHHGLTNAVLIPYVLAFNRPAIEDKITRLAAYLGLAEPGFPSFLECMIDLRRELGIPHTLRELGLGDERAEEIASKAATDPTAATNPVPLTPETLLDIYLRALDGRLED